MRCDFKRQESIKTRHRVRSREGRTNGKCSKQKKNKTRERAKSHVGLVLSPRSSPSSAQPVLDAVSSLARLECNYLLEARGLPRPTTCDAETTNLLAVPEVAAAAFHAFIRFECERRLQTRGVGATQLPSSAEQQPAPQRPVLQVTSAPLRCGSGLYIAFRSLLLSVSHNFLNAVRVGEATNPMPGMDIDLGNLLGPDVAARAAQARAAGAPLQKGLRRLS